MIIPWIYYQVSPNPVDAVDLYQYNFHLYVPTESQYNITGANCQFINTFNYNTSFDNPLGNPWGNPLGNLWGNICYNYTHLSCQTLYYYKSLIQVKDTAIPIIISQVNYSNLGGDIYYVNFVNIFSQFTYQVIVNSEQYLPNTDPVYQFIPQPFGLQTPNETNIILAPNVQKYYPSTFRSPINGFGIATLVLIGLLFCFVILSVISNTAKLYKRKRFNSYVGIN